MIRHIDISEIGLKINIRANKIQFGGNQKLKIYGLLTCKSGKRMKRENRIFFLTEKEAIANGFRPCRHCMREEYKKWGNGTI